MRVVGPYTVVHPEVRASLAGVPVEWVDVSRRVTDYHDLMERIWAEGEGFIVVEHDIVVSPRALTGLWNCNEPWCTRPYWKEDIIRAGLGCTKFSTALVRDYPATVRDIATLHQDSGMRRHWGRLDTRLRQVLEDRLRLRAHVHWPTVRHLNPVVLRGAG